jgi:hypothetical protein
MGEEAKGEGTGWGTKVGVNFEKESNAKGFNGPLSLICGSSRLTFLGSTGFRVDFRLKNSQKKGQID